MHLWLAVGQLVHQTSVDKSHCWFWLKDGLRWPMRCLGSSSFFFNMCLLYSFSRLGTISWRSQKSKCDMFNHARMQAETHNHLLSLFASHLLPSNWPKQITNPSSRLHYYRKQCGERDAINWHHSPNLSNSFSAMKDSHILCDLCDLTIPFIKSLTHMYKKTCIGTLITVVFVVILKKNGKTLHQEKS